MTGISILVILTFSAVHGQFLNCQFVNSLNCNDYGAVPLCGTDGKDYSNRCEMAKAQCRDSNLHTVNEGTCSSLNYSPPGGTTKAPMATTGSGSVTNAPGAVTSGPQTTGPTHEPIFTNHNQLLDFFCLELMHETCPTDTEKVCGTDNVTYDNFCEYEKQRCGHRTLQVKYFGDCI